MTVRVYLQAARMLNESPQASDIPVERVFISAAEVSELWVETESKAVPGPGKVVSFALAHHIDIGFERIVGTVERKVSKRTKQRIEAVEVAV